MGQFKITAQELNLDAKLCYVSGDLAFFTTQDLSKQYGDDWNDAPYEHNAGRPYTDWENGREKKNPRWRIYSLRFHCDSLVEPSEGTMNSKYSVEMINAGKIAWLRPDPYSKTNLHIFAGTTMQEFFGMIKEAGGEVYLPCELGDE